jgi:cytoskeletal protein CcmA (bactofilin family)
MWKRDESVKPTTPAPQTPSAPITSSPQHHQSPQHAASDVRTQIERDKVNIGKSVVIKGELSGSEDLTIEGHVEGRIELRENVLTIGPNGKIRAEVFAKSVIVLGEVSGNVTASEKVDIRDNGSVDGDIASPRVAIAEGAHFRGSVDMQKGGGVKGQPPGPPKVAQPGTAGTSPSSPGTPGTPATTPQSTPPSPAGQRVGA